MRLLHCVFLGLAVSCSVTGQTYTISTYADGGYAYAAVGVPMNIAGTSAYLDYRVTSVALDGAGNVFFSTGDVVLRLDASTGLSVLGELCERLFLSAKPKENELANQIADAVPAAGDPVGRGGCGEPQEATVEAHPSGRLIQELARDQRYVAVVSLS